MLKDVRINYWLLHLYNFTSILFFSNVSMSKCFWITQFKKLNNFNQMQTPVIELTVQTLGLLAEPHNKIITNYTSHVPTWKQYCHVLCLNKASVWLIRGTHPNNTIQSYKRNVGTCVTSINIPDTYSNLNQQ